MKKLLYTVSVLVAIALPVLAIVFWKELVYIWAGIATVAILVAVCLSCKESNSDKEKSVIEVASLFFAGAVVAAVIINVLAYCF